MLHSTCRRKLNVLARRSVGQHGFFRLFCPSPNGSGLTKVLLPHLAGVSIPRLPWSRTASPHNTSQKLCPIGKKSHSRAGTSYRSPAEMMNGQHMKTVSYKHNTRNETSNLASNFDHNMALSRLNAVIREGYWREQVPYPNLFLFIFTTLLVYAIFLIGRSKGTARHLPGPPALPIIGNLHQIPKSGLYERCVEVQSHAARSL